MIERYIALAQEQGVTFSGAVLSDESQKLGVSKNTIIERTYAILADMKRSIVAPVVTDERCGMVGDTAKTYAGGDYYATMLSPVMARAASLSLLIAQNSAKMGRIVAAPTAGACGILPGVLFAQQEINGYDDHALVSALINSSGVGMSVASVAGIAGAAGGCQVEVGTAGAMAASAVVELLGGTPKQCGNAVAFALKFVMGLVCDPVAGLVVCPCIKRNGAGAVNAMFAAELALCGVESMIPPDEVITAMKQVGDSMSISLKETAQGGLAITPTGKMLARQLKETADNHSRKFCLHFPDN